MYLGYSPDLFKTADKLDDVRIYNRALTATEIEQIYNEGGGTVVGKNQADKLSNGLVGYWSFNGSDFTDKVYDRSGNGNNGIVVGAATSSVKGAGKIGQGAQFSVGPYIDVGSGSSLDDLAPISVSAWINPRSAGAFNSGEIWGKAPGGGNMRLAFSGNNVLEFYRETALKSVDMRATTSPSITYNEWQHIVLTWDGTVSTNMHIYRNGIDITSGAQASGLQMLDANSTFKIGFAGSIAYDGSIDEVRVYNRILSADEIRELYEQGM
jgi:hypothetical protein